MHRFTPCLTLLALAAVPAMAAEDFSLKLKGIIQARALFLNNADNATGGQYDPLRGQNGNAEHVRVGLRRVRLAAEATTSDGWFGNVTIRAAEPNNLNGVNDTSGGNGSSTATTSSSGNPAHTHTVSVPGRGIDLYYAYVGRRFKTGIIEHDVILGMDKAFNGESSISSSTYLFPSDRVTAGAVDDHGSRNPGIFYKLNHEFVRFGLSLQNNTTTSGAGIAPGAGDAGAHNGHRISTRVEGGLLPAKKAESWAGAPGTHVVVGFDFAKNNNSYTSAAARVDHTILGPDLMVHIDGLSFLAEYKTVKVQSFATTTDVETTADNKYMAVVLGYAVPTEMGATFEPALRYQTSDIEGDVTSTNITSGGDFVRTADAREIGLGLNAYWNGHKNKTQLAFTQASATEGDAVARFVTLQHQITF